MKAFINSKWIIIGMISLLMTGTMFLLFKGEDNRKETNFGEIELLMDSLLASSGLSKRGIPFSDWVTLGTQKLMIREYASSDRLTDKDKETIITIDQNLNQLLHERNKH